MLPTAAALCSYRATRGCAACFANVAVEPWALMYTRVYMCICVGMYLYTCTYIHLYMCVHMHANKKKKHTYIHTCIHTYIHTYTRLLTYSLISLYVYIYMSHTPVPNAIAITSCYHVDAETTSPEQLQVGGQKYYFLPGAARRLAGPRARALDVFGFSSSEGLALLWVQVAQTVDCKTC